jgi:hypothetical protein
MTRHAYRPEVIAQLARHGVRPRPDTSPQLVRDFLSQLYRYELRTLRRQLLRASFPRHEYAERVIAVRRRYALLSLPLEHWTDLRATQPPVP